MSRLVCFFSVGIEPKLTAYTWADRWHESRYMLDAALQLGVVARGDDAVVFAPILTDETRKIGDEMRAAFAKSGDAWDPIEVDSAGAESVERVIDEMLEKVQDSDRVFIEPTGGLRPFQMALIAGALYLRALRDRVRVERLVYGEQSTGAIHDITFVLELFDWARDAHAFADALNAGPLLTRLRRHRRTQLDELEGPLAGGLAPQVFATLRRLTLPGDESVAAREALGLVRRRFEPLEKLVGKTKADTLDLAWLDAELSFVEELENAGRLGDATRALREWCVNVVLLGMGGAEQWNTAKARRPAESWLSCRSGGRKADTPERFADFLRVYDPVQQLRNQLSHSGYQGGEKHVPPLGRARDHVKNARAWWASNRDHLLEPRLIPPPPEDSHG